MLKFLSDVMYPETHDWSFFESLLVSLVAILVVFIILFIIILCVSGIQKIFFSEKKNKNESVSKEPKKEVSQPAKVVKNTEIKDEDMMVAALIATIDYANETKKDVRLVSIKQIG